MSCDLWTLTFDHLTSEAVFRSVKLTYVLSLMFVWLVEKVVHLPSMRYVDLCKY